jgi:pyruvate dehydrogenase E1 component beta subunit
MPWTKVFFDGGDMDGFVTEPGLRSLTYCQAILEAQRQVLEADKRVFLMGEGVDDPGGIFGTTLGLVDLFGKDRVMDIPLAENGMTGVAVGAAAAGMRPVFIHMRNDFLPMCMDQLVNHAAKWCYMTGSKVSIPLVVRAIIGRGWGSAAQHSQALHALFTHIPGLKVVVPATPYDAKGLFFAALADENPVMFIEHRWTFHKVGYVPEEIYQVPLGTGIVRRTGTDVTVVAVSHMVYEAMRASVEAEKEGIDLEVVEPRTLKPLDEETILQSVAKTGRLIIADVACRTGSFGAEIACRVCESDPGLLKAPVKRVCFPDAPTPAGPTLEQAYYPGANDILGAARQLMS